MRESERRSALVEHLRADGRASVSQLAETLDVTPSTAPLRLLPLALVPTAAVPLAIALHIVSLRRILPLVRAGAPVLVLCPGELARVDQRPADARAVAAEVLGQRVHDDVRAVFERTTEVG